MNWTKTAMIRIVTGEDWICNHLNGQDDEVSFVNHFAVRGHEEVLENTFLLSVTNGVGIFY